MHYFWLTRTSLFHQTCLLHAGTWRRSRLSAVVHMPVLELCSHGPENKKKYLPQVRVLSNFTHPDATNSLLRSCNARTRFCSHCIRKLQARYMYLGGSSSISSRHHTAIPLDNKTEFTHKMDPSNENPSGGVPTPRAISPIPGPTLRSTVESKATRAFRRHMRSATMARQPTCAEPLRFDHSPKVPPG